MDFKLALNFLDELSKNNNKEWFDSNKKTYENAKKQWIEFVAELIHQIGAFDKDILMLEPKKCIFRINRDIRFSKNKNPYKNNFGASLSKLGSKNDFCGYYFHLEPGKSFIAGGVYGPASDKLALIRQEIDYNFKEFSKLITSKSFKDNFNQLEGEKLQRPPKGYDAENPAVEILKLKSFLMQKKLTDNDLLDKNLLKNSLKVYKEMYPLNSFLYRSIA